MNWLYSSDLALRDALWALYLQVHALYSTVDSGQYKGCDSAPPRAQEWGQHSGLPNRDVLGRLVAASF